MNRYAAENDVGRVDPQVAIQYSSVASRNPPFVHPGTAGISECLVPATKRPVRVETPTAAKSQLRVESA